MFIILLLLLLKYYLVLLLNVVSYILALFLFIHIKRYNISKKNILLNRLPNNNISWLKLNYIILNSNKNFIFNIIIVPLQKYFHLNLINYYDTKSYYLPKKCQFVMMHYGLFYDLISSQKIFNRSIVGIYKGKFKNIKTDKINMMKHNMINYDKLKKYYLIATPIDQKSNSNIFVNFLGGKVKFHSNLINYSLKSNRDLYMFYIRININSLTLNIHKIDTDTEFKSLIQNVATDMTNIIRRDPGQYLWLHNRFNYNFK